MILKKKTLITALQLMNATMLAESTCFSFNFKSMDTLWHSLGSFQEGATPFSPIYPFGLLEMYVIILSEESFKHPFR